MFEYSSGLDKKSNMYTDCARMILCVRQREFRERSRMVHDLLASLTSKRSYIFVDLRELFSRRLVRGCAAV